MTICQTHQRYWLPKDYFLVVSLWTPLKQSSFIFLMGGEKEGSFAEKGPYHHHLQQPKGRELGSGLAEEFELILCSSRQGSAASPFLICMRSLLPFMTHSLHGSNPSIAPPRMSLFLTATWSLMGQPDRLVQLLSARVFYPKVTLSSLPTLVSKSESLSPVSWGCGN